jgi:phenylacetate-CoA ligase
MVGEWMRRTSFFGLDLMKGGSVKQHYNDICKKNNGIRESHDVLHHLLNYAQKNVSYYSKFNNITELSEFPIINKRTIMENYEAFQSKEFIGTTLHWVSTSGSTGQPFKASQDASKRNRTIADLIYYHKINGWNLGDRYVFLGDWISQPPITKLKKFMQNFIPVDVLTFDEQSKESLRQLLKTDKKIRVILGYASSIESFVHYLEKKGDHAGMFNLKVIFTDSDTLLDITKSKLEKMFNCPVVNRYSNEEHGVLACTSPYNHLFRLNTASYYFELLKLDRDEPAEKGEIGRLVVTDLYNRSMPFIRYDTGDLAISDDIDRKSLKTLTSFQGRVADTIMDTKGNSISSVIVSSLLADFFMIRKYQLIQDDKDSYLLKVVCNHLNSPIRNELSNACKKLLGDQSKIDIVLVDDIPLEKTGKYKSVINLYSNRLQKEIHHSELISILN